MPKISYRRPMKINSETQAVIDQALEIVNEYSAQGFDLTLRQLFYQFVSRDLIENTQKAYKKLGDVVDLARMRGQIDWDDLVDRTRFLRKKASWASAKEIVLSCSHQFKTDLWKTQDYRPEVWVEKDALVGVLEKVCNENDVPYFSCRGYVSQSEMWAASQRILEHIDDGKKVVIFHLGDHDPSGVDMTRDIYDRLMTFLIYHYIDDEHMGTHADPYSTEDKGYAREQLESCFEVKRIALTYEQILEFKPPPNPVKKTDSRWKKYVKQTGCQESWELDALSPATLAELIQDEIDQIRSPSVWNAALEEQQSDKNLLQSMVTHWAKVSQYVKKI